MTDTMYDVIMDLPLFQGISRAQVSAFLEKTHFEFLNVEPDTVIRPAGVEADSLLYIISGEVEITWQNHKGDIKITFRQGARNMLEAAHLFGMIRNTPYEAKAITATSILKIDKWQYLSLLQTQPIYLLNYLNYLSLRAQKPMEILGHKTDASPLSILRSRILAITPTDATDITIHISTTVLAQHIRTNPETVRRQLTSLKKYGIIRLPGNKISIASREQLTEGYAF